ncbi:ribokinase [Agromyces sp. SYSU T00266]|uniref:ribokinase n=1 Tax=Agromyces zhanjiangensis TaxID=3158562 RepID=UPI0033929230
MVVGSVNVDLTFTLADLPAPGETVVAASSRTGLGGKGANQAVRAAQSGFDVEVHLVSAVGADQAGTDARASLDRHHVDTTYVSRVAGTPTGRAFVSVDGSGENSIVLVPGANASLSAADVRASLDAIAGELPQHLVVVCQGEIPSPAIDAAADFAAERGARFILNLAPVTSVARSTLRASNPLIVNELEAEALATSLGGPEARPASIRDAAGIVHRALGVSVIVTRGASGVQLVDRLGVEFAFPSVPVDRIVDTTGAGDAFVGTLAASLAAGDSTAEAVQSALAAGARAVQSRGAGAELLARGSVA